MESIKYLCSNEFDIHLLVRYVKKDWIDEDDKIEIFNVSDYICLFFSNGKNHPFVIALTDSRIADRFDIYESAGIDEVDVTEDDDEEEMVFRELTERELLLVEEHIKDFDTEIDVENNENSSGFIGSVNPAEIIQKMLRKGKINKLKH